MCHDVDAHYEFKLLVRTYATKDSCSELHWNIASNDFSKKPKSFNWPCCLVQLWQSTAQCFVALLSSGMTLLQHTQRSSGSKVKVCIHPCNICIFHALRCAHWQAHEDSELNACYRQVCDDNKLLCSPHTTGLLYVDDGVKLISRMYATNVGELAPMQINESTALMQYDVFDSSPGWHEAIV